MGQALAAYTRGARGASTEPAMWPWACLQSGLHVWLCPHSFPKFSPAAVSAAFVEWASKNPANECHWGRGMGSLPQANNNAGCLAVIW